METGFNNQVSCLLNFRRSLLCTVLRQLEVILNADNAMFSDGEGRLD